jgi:RNA polymerase sigma factor (sigma-70 family)
MKHSRRVEIFRRVKADYTGFLTSVLWKLTGDRELFSEALQNAMLGMWKNVEKLNGKKAGTYIYRIALSANSKAWRNRIGRDGQIGEAQVSDEKVLVEKIGGSELTGMVRRTISQLPAKQGRAISMRYLEQQSYETIAERLGCTEAGARSNVSKALTALKDKLVTLTKTEA